MPDREAVRHSRAMRSVLVPILRRWAAAVIVAAGFMGSLLSMGGGLSIALGCDDLGCFPDQGNPLGLLLLLLAAVLIPSTMAIASAVACADRRGQRIILAAPWVPINVLVAGMAFAIEARIPGSIPYPLAFQMALVSLAVGGILILCDAWFPIAAVAWGLALVATVVALDAIVPVGASLVFLALLVPGRSQARYSA